MAGSLYSLARTPMALQRADRGAHVAEMRRRRTDDFKKTFTKLLHLARKC